MHTYQDDDNTARKLLDLSKAAGVRGDLASPYSMYQDRHMQAQARGLRPHCRLHSMQVIEKLHSRLTADFKPPASATALAAPVSTPRADATSPWVSRLPVSPPASAEGISESMPPSMSLSSSPDSASRCIIFFTPPGLVGPSLSTCSATHKAWGACLLAGKVIHAQAE